jgi:2-amino-4-hydroxy-6-hydroxymethyldihydropteridine diphosphokinase
VASACIALGANIGQPCRQILDAVEALAALPDTRLTGRSRLYRTPPWGPVEQPPFINAVADIDTRLAPHELMQALLQIEHAAGRDRQGPRWGPRRLDLDLLLYDAQVLDTPTLTLPHPRIAGRAFVLLPLADLDPERMIPGQGRVADLLARVDTAGCAALEDDTL